MAAKSEQAAARAGIQHTIACIVSIAEFLLLIAPLHGPPLVHRFAGIFSVLPETVPSPTEASCECVFLATPCQPPALPQGAYSELLSMLNSGVLSELGRCRPDVGKSPQVGFFFQASWRRPRDKPQPEEAKRKTVVDVRVWDKRRVAVSGVP